MDEETTPGASVAGGRKRSAADFEEDDMYLRYKNKRMRVLHTPDLPNALANSNFRTFMIMTDEMEESLWGDRSGAYFKNALQSAVQGAMLPESYIVISNHSGVEDVMEDEIWANRKAGNMIHTLCDRVDWLNEQLGRLKESRDEAKNLVQKLLREKEESSTAEKRRIEEEQRAAEEVRAANERKYRDYFHHVRYRSMIQYAQNRGYLKAADSEKSSDSAKLIGRLRAISTMLHGGDLEADVALAESEYVALHQGEAPKQFYPFMFQKIYMMDFKLAKWLVKMANKYQEVGGWINLIDRYILATDSALKEFFDWNNKVPKMGHQDVKDIFERTDILYRKFVSELEKFMKGYMWLESNKKPPKQLQYWDTAKVTRAAADFNTEAGKLRYWDKLKGCDLWGPTSKYQVQYDSPHCKQQAKSNVRI